MSQPHDDAPTGFVLYQTEDGQTRVACRLEEKTLWLSQAQMAELFQTSPQNVTLHLRAIYEEAELSEEVTCKQYLQVQTEGNRSVSRQVRHYPLEAILAVGFRVRSHRGTQFRRWATERLREYLVKGFTMDDDRLAPSILDASKLNPASMLPHLTGLVADGVATLRGKYEYTFNAERTRLLFGDVGPVLELFRDPIAVSPQTDAAVGAVRDAALHYFAEQE